MIVDVVDRVYYLLFLLVFAIITNQIYAIYLRASDSGNRTGFFHRKSGGQGRALSDDEHCHIVQLRSEGNTLRGIRDIVHRSTETIHRHIHEHNQAIDKRGSCPKCAVAGSIYATEKIE